MTLWAIRGDRGYLAGTGTACFLAWHKAAYKGKLYKHRQSAENVLKRLSQRNNPVNAEICEIEFIVHGTVHEIVEREAL